LNYKKTIYIVRHGQTDFNKLGIVQGSGVNSDLNSLGKLQAEAFYKHYKEVKFDRIYTSELNRTIQSVEPFTNAGHDIVSLAGFNEINWGIVEGVAMDSNLKREFYSITYQWSQGVTNIAIDGGETPEEMQLRQRDGIATMLEKTKDTNILIASHGRAMRALICTMLEIPLSRMDEFHHTNFCLYVLQYENGIFSLKTRNDTDHLNGLYTKS
jgi:broad specificity phosphatase PhoE